MGKRPVQQSEAKRVRLGLWRLVRIAAVLVIVVGTAIFAINILDNIAEVEAETAQIQEQVRIQEYIRQDVGDEAAFAQSRAFIERVARSWGFVHRDEIIFVPAD